MKGILNYKDIKNLNISLIILHWFQVEMIIYFGYFRINKMLYSISPFRLYLLMWLLEKF